MRKIEESKFMSYFTAQEVIQTGVIFSISLVGLFITMFCFFSIKLENIKLQKLIKISAQEAVNLQEIIKPLESSMHSKISALTIKNTTYFTSAARYMKYCG